MNRPRGRPEILTDPKDKTAILRLLKACRELEYEVGRCESNTVRSGFDCEQCAGTKAGRLDQ